MLLVEVDGLTPLTRQSDDQFKCFLKHELTAVTSREGEVNVRTDRQRRLGGERERERGREREREGEGEEESYHDVHVSILPPDPSALQAIPAESSQSPEGSSQLLAPPHWSVSP